MTASPKINISAIMKKKEPLKDDKKVKENTEVNTSNTITEDQKNLQIETRIEKSKNEVESTEIKEGDEKEEKGKSKISLESIRASKSKMQNDEIKEDKEEEKHADMKEELTEVLNGEENGVDKIVKEEDDKKTIDKIAAKINKKVDEETKEKLKLKEQIEDEKIDEDENKEIFGNYKSDFKEKETVIIENVEEKKSKLRERLKEPKTRIILVVALIVITTLIIGGLFVFSPENHSISKYKSGIETSIKTFKVKYIDKPWIAETIQIESYSFDIETQEKKGDKKNYKYKGVLYESKADFDQVVNSEVREMKAEIARKEEEARIEKERIEAEKVEAERIEKEKKAIKEALFNRFK